MVIDFGLKYNNFKAKIRHFIEAKKNSKSSIE